MKSTCKRCGNEIKELNFDEELKLEIWGMVNQDLKLFAVKKLIDEYKWSHKEAKVFIAHFNKEFGKCHRCNFEDLMEENIECPKCKSFNYNWKIESPFDQEFCSHLEYKLDFDELENEEVRGFWCDGVDNFPNDLKHLSKSNISKRRQLITRAWIGKGGQTIYKMLIKFGDKSVENYEENKSLIDCIPEGNYRDWIFIDPEKKEIEITLK